MPLLLYSKIFWSSSDLQSTKSNILLPFPTKHQMHYIGTSTACHSLRKNQNE